MLIGFAGVARACFINREISRWQETDFLNRFQIVDEQIIHCQTSMLGGLGNRFPKPISDAIEISLTLSIF
jgi:hypothetical protein